MERILFLSHTESDRPLGKVALETLSAAVGLAGQMEGASFIVGLIGENAQEAADAIAGCGAEAFLGVTGTEFSQSRYSSDVAAAEALARTSEADLILIPTTSRTSRIMGGLAQRLEGRIDSHVAGLQLDQDGLHVDRWYYRQRMLATFGRSHRPWILGVEGGVFGPWTGESGSATLKGVSVDFADKAPRTEFLGEESAGVETQTIRPDADLLLVAGAGWTKKQSDGETHVKNAESLIFAFLEKTRASLGSSKSLVDQASEGQEVISFMSHLNQVGQTGSSPRHAKGLATCCHGEEPHVVGWRFIKERRAINTDPGCGWARGKADVLYVADAFQVMAKVNELLG
jgi:electron transfer flavoprotein alpha subunit